MPALYPDVDSFCEDVDDDPRDIRIAGWRAPANREYHRVNWAGPDEKWERIFFGNAEILDSQNPVEEDGRLRVYEQQTRYSKGTDVLI